MRKGKKTFEKKKKNQNWTGKLQLVHLSAKVILIAVVIRSYDFNS